MKSIRELYGQVDKEEKKEQPKSKWYKLGEKIALDAIKKVEKKYTKRDLEYFFLEARKTHLMLGVKHKDFKECFEWFEKYGTEK